MTRPATLVHARAVCLSIILLLALAVVATLASCGGSGDHPTTTGVSATQTSKTAGSTSSTSPDATPDTSEASPAPKGLLTAKEAMDLLLSEARKWAKDAVPLNLGAVSRNAVIESGRCNYWTGSFYSPTLGEVYAFTYYQDAYMSEPEIGRALKPLFQDVDWQVGDLFGSWTIDSPRVADIAADRGLAKIVQMEISLRKTRPDVNPPQEVPEGCQVYWRIEDDSGKSLFIDATSGEVLE